MLVGLLAWLVGLAVVAAAPLLGMELPGPWLWTCIAGVVLGSLGLAFAQRPGAS